ncbi:MAG: hypothetical protein JW833_02805 [Prolixibacteraceae bacterium]|nr:hypothetical protein [Prolixibacteraceae bacterium]
MNNIFKKRIALYAFILLIVFPGKGEEIKKNKKVSILPVPAIGYSPETKTYIGAVTLFTIKNLDDSLTRTSNTEIEFNYTWNKQVILETGWNYFSEKEKWFSRGVIHYSKYPDLYYGIGAKTNADNEVNFQSNRFNLESELFRNIKNNLFLGFGISYTDYSRIEYSENQNIFPELKGQNTTGFSVVFLNENRNNILSPTQVSFFEFNNSFNFSSSFYFQAKLDFRKYFRMRNNIIAGRIFHTTISGNPPFYNYALLGGDKFVRGYYLGRFRDKNFSTFQMEYRTNLFWKIGFAAFGGISSVYNNFHNIEKDNFKPNAGLGLRFLIDKEENTNLRIDYAIGSQKQSGFYISFGESF